MKLTNQSIPNSVSDARYQAALSELVMHQSEEYEEVHNGSGQSEELPSDLARRHARERRMLAKNRDQFGIMEWVLWYGNAVA